MGRIDARAEQLSWNFTWLCLGGPAVTCLTGTPVILPVAVFSANAACASGWPAGAFIPARAGAVRPPAVTERGYEEA